MKTLLSLLMVMLASLAGAQNGHYFPDPLYGNGSGLTNLSGTFTIINAATGNIASLNISNVSGSGNFLGIDGSGNVIRTNATAGLATNATVIVSNVWDVSDIRYWGAVPNDGTDDTAAIQACINNNPREVYIPNGVWLIRSLNATARSNLTIHGQGPSALLDGGTNGYPMLDMIGSSKMRVYDLTLECTGGAQTPSCAILIGRTNAESAGEHVFNRVWCYGKMSVAAFFSKASEQNTFNDCTFSTGGLDPAPTARFFCGKSATNSYSTPITSLFQAVTGNGAGGNSLNKFRNCTFATTSSQPGSVALVIEYGLGTLLDHCFWSNDGSTNLIVLSKSTAGFTMVGCRQESTGVLPRSGLHIADTNRYVDIHINDCHLFPFYAVQGSTVAGLVWDSSYWNGTNGVNTEVFSVDTLSDSVLRASDVSPDMSTVVADGAYRVRTNALGNTISGIKFAKLLGRASQNAVITQTNNFTILPRGRVGVGTTNGPLNTFDILTADTAANSSGSGNPFRLSNGTGAADDNGLFMGVSDSAYAWIQSIQPTVNVRDLALQPQGGKVGIGTTTPSSSLEVAGAVTASNLNLTTLTGTGSNLVISAGGIVSRATVASGGGGTAGATDLFMQDTNRIVFSNGTAFVMSPTNDAIYLFNTNGTIATLLFSDGSTGGAGFQSAGGAFLNAVTSYSNVVNLATMVMRAIKLTNGAVNGYVLTSDANGLASWQVASGSSSNYVALWAGTGFFNSAFVTNGLGVNGILTVGTSAILGNNVPIIWTSAARLKSQTDGVILAQNNAQTDFIGLQLGGTTAGFPTIGRTNGNLVILGGDGVYGNKSTNQLIVSGGIDITGPIGTTTNAPLFHAGTNAANGLTVRSNGTLQVDAPLLFGPDNTYAIGASGANRPSALWVGGGITAATLTASSTSASPTFYVGSGVGSISLVNPAVGVLTMDTFTPGSLSRINIGTATAAFPAIGRQAGDILILGADGVPATATNRLILTGGLVMGGTNSTVTLTNVLYASATLDFPSTTAGNSSDLFITVAGAADGDIVSLGVPSPAITPPQSGVYNAWASNGVVYVRYANNNLVTAQDPTNGTFKVRVDKFK